MPTSLARTTTAAIALLVGLSLAPAAPAAAQEEAPKLGLTPVDQEGPYFQLRLEPGETIRLQVEAANFGEGEVLARTYAADVYTIINGGFGIELFGEPPAGTTLWLDYPTREETLGPQDAVTIEFEVEVPPGTPPGEYVTALVIENVEPFEGSGSVSIDQVNRGAIAVAVDVPGPRRPELQIGEVDHHTVGEHSIVTFEVENPGNVHLKPAGEFRLRDASGDDLTIAPVAMDSVYAGTGTLLEAPLAELLPEGDYCAELRLTDEETGATAETTCLPFSVAAPVTDDDRSESGAPPLPFTIPSDEVLVGAAPFIGVAIALGALGLLLLLARRRRRAPAPSTTEGASWPASDVPATTPAADAVDELDPLRTALRSEEQVSRAWIIPRGETIVLAIEAPHGTTAADGTRVAARIRQRLERLDLDPPLSVVYLQGAGPVERATAGLAPFYVRAPMASAVRRADA